MKTTIHKSKYGFTVITMPLCSDYESLPDAINDWQQISNIYIRYCNVLPYEATELFEYVKTKFNDIYIVNVVELRVPLNNEKSQFKHLFKYICKHNKNALIFIDPRKINTNNNIMNKIFSKYMIIIVLSSVLTSLLISYFIIYLN